MASLRFMRIFWELYRNLNSMFQEKRTRVSANEGYAAGELKMYSCSRDFYKS